MEYKKGKENKAADALSRKEKASAMQPGKGFVSSSLDVASLFLISFPCHTWMTILKDSYNEDAEYQQLFTSLSGNSSKTSKFSLQNGLLLYKDKVFLSSSSPFEVLGSLAYT